MAGVSFGELQVGQFKHQLRLRRLLRQEGLARDTTAAWREGFAGRIAIDPDQVETINRSFSPTEAELEHARRVVDVFATTTAGTVGRDGRVLIPHLKQAERLLVLADNAHG
jgi:citrate lyase subunit beta/citryl-CoA lyase